MVAPPVSFLTRFLGNGRFGKKNIRKMNLLYVRTVYICETGFVFINKGGEDVDEFEKLLDSVRVAV